jgi:hypothetical protein
MRERLSGEKIHQQSHRLFASLPISYFLPSIVFSELKNNTTSPEWCTKIRGTRTVLQFANNSIDSFLQEWNALFVQVILDRRNKEGLHNMWYLVHNSQGKHVIITLPLLMLIKSQLSPHISTSTESSPERLLRTFLHWSHILLFFRFLTMIYLCSCPVALFLDDWIHLGRLFPCRSYWMEKLKNGSITFYCSSDFWQDLFVLMCPVALYHDDWIQDNNVLSISTLTELIRDCWQSLFFFRYFPR